MQPQQQIIQMPNTESPLASALMKLKPMMDMWLSSAMQQAPVQGGPVASTRMGASPFMGGAMPPAAMPPAKPMMGGSDWTGDANAVQSGSMDIGAILRLFGLQ